METSLVILILILSSPVLASFKLAVKRWQYIFIPVLHLIALIACYYYISEQPSHTGDATPGAAFLYLFAIIFIHIVFILPSLVISSFVATGKDTPAFSSKSIVKLIATTIGITLLWFFSILLWVFFNWMRSEIIVAIERIFSWFDPLHSGFIIDCNSRYDHMNMWMIIRPSWICKIVAAQGMAGYFIKSCLLSHFFHGKLNTAYIQRRIHQMSIFHPLFSCLKCWIWFTPTFYMNYRKPKRLTLRYAGVIYAFYKESTIL